MPTWHQFPAQQRWPASPHDWQVADEELELHTFDWPQ